jgi:hypothetical protein
MTDTTLTDLGPFFDRHDRRTRLVSFTAIAASLVLSAVILTHGVDAAGRIGSEPPLVVVTAVWVVGFVFPLCFHVGWWLFTEHMARGRRRTAPADGSHPAGAVDARDGVRVANGGFAFHLVVTVAVLAEQAFMALLAFGYMAGDLMPRAICVAVGAVTIYLGNLWPRMPTPRVPEKAAAIRMRANRIYGWVMVACGLLLVMLGVFLPLIHPHGWPGQRP